MKPRHHNFFSRRLFMFFSFFNFIASFLQAELQWDWRSIDPTTVSFPKNFVWGVGTSAHQVEGNCSNNNWSAWELSVDPSGNPRIKDGQKAGIACDHWNRYKEDIQLMKQLGIKAYRFSVEWSKIEPRAGFFNQEALNHYSDVCDALLAADIKPVITLHHFTHPYWFDQLGSFEKDAGRFKGL